MSPHADDKDIPSVDNVLSDFLSLNVLSYLNSPPIIREMFYHKTQGYPSPLSFLSCIFFHHNTI